MSTPRSLVLITVDCLRADHVGFLGYARGTTPFLDTLSAESVVFANAIVAGSPTYYSFPAIMASRSPLAFGRDVVGLVPDEPTIASTLHDSGYATAAFLAANPYLSPRFGYHQGFGVFEDFLGKPDSESAETITPSSGNSIRSKLNRSLAETFHKFGPLGKIYDELYFQYCQHASNGLTPSWKSLQRFPTADVIVDHAEAWLRTLSGKPFFLWLHFMDPHSPYYPNQESLRVMENGIDPARAQYINSFWNRGDLGPNRLGRHRKEIIALYDAGIRWVDIQLSRLQKELVNLGLWNDCVFALTADHGEEFLDHGGRYHSPAKLYEELIHVPLLIRTPEISGSVKTAPVSLTQLAPTLCEVLDIPAPWNFRGSSVLTAPLVQDAPVIAESIGRCTNPFQGSQRLNARILCVRSADHKLILDFGSSEEQFFNLRNDPRELNFLPLADETKVRKRLLGAARDYMSDSLQLRNEDQRFEAQLQRLRLEWQDSVGSRPS